MTNSCNTDLQIWTLSGDCGTSILNSIDLHSNTLSFSINQFINGSDNLFAYCRFRYPCSRHHYCCRRILLLFFLSLSSFLPLLSLFFFFPPPPLFPLERWKIVLDIDNQPRQRTITLFRRAYKVCLPQPTWGALLNQPALIYFFCHMWYFSDSSPLTDFDIFKRKLVVFTKCASGWLREAHFVGTPKYYYCLQSWLVVYV